MSDPGTSSDVKNENTPPSPASAGSAGNNCACGPSCGCGSPAGSNKVKLLVSLIVLMAVASILIYKASASRGDASNVSGTAGAIAYAFAAPATSPTANAASEQKSLALEGPAKPGEKIGDTLESLNDLNTVAVSQDGVFILISAANGHLADDKTSTALLSAQRTLKSSQIAVGLYTLPASSPDYSAISTQVQAPAVLVASKGKGMAAVSGDITEARLLQAFVATARGGGCGPSSSGCGPSSGACN